MTIQTLAKPNQRNSRPSFSSCTKNLVEPSQKVSPQDFALEINEVELADEMSAFYSDRPLSQVVVDLNREPFETIYQWFLA